MATIQTILDRCDDNNTSLSIDDIEVIKTNLCRIIKRAKSICHNHYNNINLLNMDTKDRIKQEQNKPIGLICHNIYELTYAMHEFNNGKYDETRTGEVINEMSTMSKEIGWPVVVMDTLEYYAGSADDEVLEMDVHEYVEKKYNDYHIVYICNTYNDMVERLDGYIYGIMDKDGKVICDLAEPDYINLASGGVINEDNMVDDDMINNSITLENIGYHKIGSIFKYNIGSKEVELEVVESSDASCEGCVFNNSKNYYCKDTHCIDVERKDDIDVIYKEVKRS